MDLQLEISPSQQNTAWQQKQYLSILNIRFGAYINRLALLSVLPWLESAWRITATPASSF